MNPKLSIVIPIHDMQGGADFLWKSINALTEQTFQDFEIVITKQGTMAENTNAGIKRARGELIKILYLDDCLAYPNALQDIVDAFTPDTEWLITGVDNNVMPEWTDDIEKGNNKLGSPSALTIRNHGLDTPLFDEQMTWLLDCDYYKRLYIMHGEPKILYGPCVLMGIGEHQVSHLLSDEDKLKEHNYMKQKYD